VKIEQADVAARRQFHAEAGQVPRREAPRGAALIICG